MYKVQLAQKIEKQQHREQELNQKRQSQEIRLVTLNQWTIKVLSSGEKVYRQDDDEDVDGQRQDPATDLLFYCYFIHSEDMRWSAEKVWFGANVLTQGQARPTAARHLISRSSASSITALPHETTQCNDCHSFTCPLAAEDHSSLRSSCFLFFFMCHTHMHMHLQLLPPVLDWSSLAMEYIMPSLGGFLDFIPNAPCHDLRG